jgi:hypothetical protein
MMPVNIDVAKIIWSLNRSKAGKIILICLAAVGAIFLFFGLSFLYWAWQLANSPIK